MQTPVAKTKKIMILSVCFETISIVELKIDAISNVNEMV